jgi:hypothetical protein
VLEICWWGKGRVCSAPSGTFVKNTNMSVVLSAEDKLMAQRKKEDELKEQKSANRQKGIFDGLVVYVNGSTYPLVSDHKLKQLLAENGGRIALHMGRKQLTHVVLGRPNGAPGAGAGGGLAGGKMEKEIRRIGRRGIKYVGVEWSVHVCSNSHEVAK